MATVYKNGSWAEHGRVMPGCRVKPKRIDQIISDGSVICIGSDQKFTVAEIEGLLADCFPGAKKLNKRIYLPAIDKEGKGVCFYPRNINHLGGDWGPEKKRIQIGEDFPGIYEENLV